MNRIKSHPDVGERWYPELLKQLRQQQQDDMAAKQQHNSGDISNATSLDSLKQQKHPIEAH